MSRATWRIRFVLLASLGGFACGETPTSSSISAPVVQSPAVGEILKDRSNQILVGTKVRFAMGQGPNEGGLSRFHIIEQCEASLKRLQRDRIDLYFLHEWDGQTPVEEMMEALDTLVKQGKVRYTACSNFSGWHIMKALAVAAMMGLGALSLSAPAEAGHGWGGHGWGGGVGKRGPS